MRLVCVCVLKLWHVSGLYMLCKKNKNNTLDGCGDYSICFDSYLDAALTSTTLTSTSTPDLAGYPRIINVGSSTIVPLAPFSEMLRRPRHRPRTQSRQVGEQARESAAPAQVLRHLTVASGSPHSLACLLLSHCV